MSARFSLKLLESEDRSDFSCGSKQLDEYFKQRASQDMRRRATGCYITIEKTTGLIAGFYTISAAHTELKALPESWKKQLPKYPRVPTVLVGRLAVDERFRGLKIGSALILDAAARAMRSELIVSLMAVEAKDDAAAQFYLHHGFKRDPNNLDYLFAPVKTLATGFG